MFYSQAFATSDNQKSLLFSSGNVNVQSFALSETLNFSSMKQVLQQVVDDFEILRYCFSEDGRWCYVREKAFLQLEEVNLDQGKKNLHSLIDDEYANSFDLKNGPCYRMKLVKVSPRKTVLLFSCHPILATESTFQKLSCKIDHLVEKPTDLSPEAVMNKIWSSVLNLDSIGPEDNFFELGGHSLLAIELAEKLRIEYKKDVQVRDIFECPTMNELLIRLDVMQTTGPGKKLKTCQWNRTQGELSFNQMQVWYVEALFPDTKMHNLSTSLRIKWAVDPKLLEKTLHLMFERHEALRTIITPDDHGPLQQILPASAPVFTSALEVIRISEDQVTGLMKNETAKKFDLGVAPLFKAKLYQLAPDDFVFFFMVHHVIWDGWCFDIFFDELNTIYSALEKGEKPFFEKDPGMTYLEFSSWQRASEKEGVFDPQKTYWKNKLKMPLPILELPLDFPRPKTPTHHGGNFRYSLSQNEIISLKRFAATKSVSIFHVLLTAFKMSLSQMTGQSDIIVGSPIRGRNESELHHTIGYFVNTVALRSTIDLKRSFEENLKTVTSTCLEAFSNQDLPFEVLLKEIPYPRDLSRTAVFQTYFTFQDMTNRKFTINGREVKQVSVNNASVKTDFDMWAKVTTYSIEGAIEYRADLFKEETVKKFYQIFHALIGQLGERKEERPQSWFEAYVHRIRSNLWTRFKDDSFSIL